MNTKRRTFGRRPSRSQSCVKGLSRRQALQRRGATMVEFAIIANLFMIMILTCMEFARMNMARNLMQDAAYFGARHAVVPGATQAEAIEAAESVLESMLSNGYTVTVSELNADAEEIDVTVEIDLAAVALFAPYFLPETTISTTANMRTERYSGFYQQ